LLFSPDVQLWPAFKLNASNPGQFYYNIIVAQEDLPEDGSISITIPYPFVTQGAQPVHVYPGDVFIKDNCFVPEERLALYTGGPVITMDDYSSYCGPDDSQAPSHTFIMTIPPEAFESSGLAYINVHLDYGLKGLNPNDNPCVSRYDQGTYISPWGSSDALEDTDINDGSVRVKDLENRWFSYAAGDVQFGDFIQNVNLFKKIAGAFGRVGCESQGAGLANYYLELVSNGKVVKSGFTDEDGYYSLPYKHKGKQALYDIRLYAAKPEVEPSFPLYTTNPGFYLQSNGWVELNLSALLCEAPTEWHHTYEYGQGRYAK
jgi:hypothetical protein